MDSNVNAMGLPSGVINVAGKCPVTSHGGFELDMERLLGIVQPRLTPEGTRVTLQSKSPIRGLSHHWIGLRENLQETIVLTIKCGGFRGFL